jgi:hypothetical protein
MLLAPAEIEARGFTGKRRAPIGDGATYDGAWVDGKPPVAACRPGPTASAMTANGVTAGRTAKAPPQSTAASSPVSGLPAPSATATKCKRSVRR